MRQVAYFSHGGGPLPILSEVGHQEMIDFLSQLPLQIEKPEAILVVSAHWEESRPTFLGAGKPPMLYDYYGFPQEAYSLTYEASGCPELVTRLAEGLKHKGWDAQIDFERGFDHGLYIPLMLMYPHAEIPSFQLSLLSSLDPKQHLELGRVLGELLPDNVLVIGSGFSFHNMKEFSFNGGHVSDRANDAFQDWLIDVCTVEMTQAEREQRLVHWENAPSARYCHPREEHLLPLHVCMGAADSAAKLVFDDYILGKRAVAFLWS